MSFAWLRNSHKIRSGGYQRSEKLKHDNGKDREQKRQVFVYRWHPVVFNELQGKQIVYTLDFKLSPRTEYSKFPLG